MYCLDLNNWGTCFVLQPHSSSSTCLPLLMWWKDSTFSMTVTWRVTLPWSKQNKLKWNKWNSLWRPQASKAITKIFPWWVFPQWQPFLNPKKGVEPDDLRWPSPPHVLWRGLKTNSSGPAASPCCLLLWRPCQRQKSPGTKMTRKLAIVVSIVLFVLNKVDCGIIFVLGGSPEEPLIFWSAQDHWLS